MSSLSKDLNISNNQSPSKPLSKNSVLSKPFSNVESDIKAQSLSVSRRKMISDIKDYKKDLSEKSNFKRGSASVCYTDLYKDEDLSCNLIIVDIKKNTTLDLKEFFQYKKV